jgi:hypothetical protein
MLPAGQVAVEAFYRVVYAAYEKRSVAISSNLRLSGFDELMPKTLAGPTVDTVCSTMRMSALPPVTALLQQATRSASSRGRLPERSWMVRQRRGHRSVVVTDRSQQGRC